MTVNPVNNKEMVPFEHYTAVFAGINPDEAAKRCNVKYDAARKVFTVRLLGTDYEVSWPNFAIACADENAFALTNIPAQMLIIRYLSEGAYSRGSGAFKTYRELPWGEVYVRQFTGRCITRAAFSFGTRIEAFKTACVKLGGIPMNKGDASAQFEIMPGYDVHMIVWEGDDEFPPNAQILFSDNFQNGFNGEDRVVVGDILITMLKKNL